MPTKELSIIQKMYDFLQWYVSLLNKLPRQHKFALGERIVTLLYEILEQLIAAKYAREKLALLQGINARLEVLRYQTRLLYDFRLIAVNRYEFAAQATHDIGVDLGGLIRQQSGRGTRLEEKQSCDSRDGNADLESGMV